MSLEAKHALNLSYPIFIDGVRFSSSDFLRSQPKWWWSSKKKDAFFSGDERVKQLEISLILGDYQNFSYYHRIYKVRDYLNSGKPEDYPKINSNSVEFFQSNILMNRIIQGG